MPEKRELDTLYIQHTSEHVSEVVLNRPQKRNAINAALFNDLERAFQELDERDATRAIVLRGEGSGFCAGLDLTEAATDFTDLFTPGLAGPRLALRRLIRDLQRKTSAPFRCQKPVVAAVHGWCIGAGLDLVSFCDLRLCSADAKISLREGRVGMVADLGSLQRLPQIIGDAATRELALTAKDIDAQRALGLGLVSHVAESQEALLKKARDEAAAVAALSPLVTKGIKHLLNRGCDEALQRGLQDVATWNSAFLQSEDLNEAFAAFLAKRAPVYKGE